MLSVHLSIPPPIDFWMSEPIFMKFGMYIMGAWAHLNGVLAIYPSHLSVYMCIPLLLLVNGSVKTLPRQRMHK
jgi:hypothetical protein